MNGRSRPPLWLWINLLSLDAPLVAIVWQDFLARCFPSVLLPAGRLVLGLTVWAIYLADRLIDVTKAAAQNETSRHQFYRRNTIAAKTLLAAILFVDLLAALFWLRPAVFSNGLLTASAVITYLAFFVLFRAGSVWKQLSAGLLFTAGVFLVAWTGIPEAWRVLGWPAAAFTALCLFNLVLIERWDSGQSTPYSWLLMGAFALICLWAGSRWYAAIAVSSAVLGLLEWRRAHVSQDARRVLADAALLTPLLALGHII